MTGRNPSDHVLDSSSSNPAAASSSTAAWRFIVFGHNDWWVWEHQGFSTRNAALVRELGRRADVESLAVVDTPRFALRSHRPLRRRLDSVCAVAPRTMAVGFDYRLPLPGRWALGRRLNESLVVPGLRRRLRKATAGRGLRVIWVADPRLVRLAALLPRDVLVFDAIDDWRQHSWAGREAVVDGYRRAAREADIVFAVNPSLLEWLRPTGRAEVLYNAVDPVHWASGAGAPRDDRRGPVIGYAGMIQSRLDLALLSAVARRLPEASFVLAGPVRRGALDSLADLPGNVRFVGRVAHSALPELVGGWDAAVVPHRRDALTASMDPLKLYEYIAAGKPVVSTVASLNPALTRFVRVEDDADAFAEALREELASDSSEARAARRRAVAHETWPARVDRVLQVLGLRARGR